MAKEKKESGLISQAQLLNNMERTDYVKYRDMTGKNRRKNAGESDHCSVDGRPCDGVCQSLNHSRHEPCLSRMERFVSIRELRRLKRQKRKFKQEEQEDDE
jgi:hypothetical protein